ncbi:glycosyl hydrolase [Hymenobacter metallilatus]|uniref:T9SS C-terminal target domain-containing protein n=1 Tax=Hymenobacter metallilatus TaxID=2493666 RepID=A0A428JH79_9BACT|nr:glycosyl hydrolase [Hymenobacter metallilatus]RSK31744.1 T9SS C-terminal target domain-containing protein [Hymenobacter metallilatus]
MILRSRFRGSRGWVLGGLLILLAWAAAATAQTKSAKRGLAYGYHSAADMQVLAPGISWWYNWASQPDAGAAGVYTSLGVDYVPMQWGRNLGNGPVTANQLAASIPNSSRYLLGFNEPNFLSQANLTPSQAAALWPVLEDVARRKNLALVSPAVNYCGNCVTENGVTYYSPTQYLDAFFAACPNCRVDYIAVHTYVCEERWLREKIAELKRYNKPIWLTEFACGDLPPSQITLPLQQKYLLDAVNYLEKEPAIFRYAWFSGRNGEIPFINLLGNSGQLTALGQQYVSLPQGWEAGRIRPVGLTASSQETNATSATAAADENINTRWGSVFADPQYLTLDFGSLHNISRVQVSWEAAYAKDYHLQTSPDGLTWTNIQTVLNSDGGVDNLTGLSARGRYLRLYATRRATAYGYSLWEIEVFGSPVGAPTATHAQADTEPLGLYPNPAATELHFSLPPNTRLRSLVVLDARGRLVLTDYAPGATLHIAALPAGLYVVRATTTSHRQLTQRFLKR